MTDAEKALIEINGKLGGIETSVNDIKLCLFNQPHGIAARFEKLESEHIACLKRHADEQKRKQDTADMAIHEEKQAKLAWLDKKFAALLAVASSPWVIDAIKWFLTPKK